MVYDIQCVAMLRAGSKVDSIDFWTQRVRQIETAIHREQHRILGGLPLNPITSIMLASNVSEPEQGLAMSQSLHLLGRQCCMPMHEPSSGEV